MNFWKMQGTGNDFVLVDGFRYKRFQWPALARAICDRHFGVGADGLVLCLPAEIGDIRMRMFNPDGSEAEMCGNGIRCLAKYAYERGLTRKNPIRVQTAAGERLVSLRLEHDRVIAATVNMGTPGLQPVLPLNVSGEALVLTCVAMGNPHAVAFVDSDPEAYALEKVGPLVENSRLFPMRVNFEVCQVVSPSKLKVRVWERGAGLTLACGTGACAVAVAARLRGAVGDECEVQLPGGSLTVHWSGHGDVLMTGLAETVFTGTWPGRKR